MRLKLKNLTVLISMLCLSQAAAYGAQMTLNYDGKSQVYDKAPISLYVNNELVEPAIMPPVQIDGYVLVPTREVFNAMGAYVQWKSEEKKVYIENKDSLIVLELNSAEAWVNGEIKTMDMVPKAINDKVMVPIRFISETLGFKVDWLGVERCVYISEQNASHGNNIDENINEDNTIHKEENMTDHKTEDSIVKEENTTNTGSTLSAALPYLSYNSSTQMLTLDEKLEIDEDNITIDDIYTKHKVVLNISGGDLSQITEGSWKGSLGYLKAVTVTKSEGSAQIVMETNTLCATTLSTKDNKVGITLMKPREKYDKIIVVDAGHGGSDSGTSANGVNEKDLTLAYSNALCSLLEADDSIKVYATRSADIYATEGNGTVGKQYPTLDMRVDLANEIEPDLYISVHINYYASGAPNGVETYYYASSDTRGEEFANMVQKALVNEFNMTDRKAKHGDLKVIRETNDPAILIEAGFISNAGDFEILTSYDYPSRFAQTVYHCILEYYGQGMN